MLAGFVVALGALVQGSVGFGLALVATPLLALIDPSYVPVPVLMLVMLHAAASLLREGGHADRRGVGWAVLGRVPGAAVGVLAVVLLPPRAFAIAVAALVLLCCAISLAPLRVRPVPGLLVAAGLVGGVSGTAASIDGPPLALLYQEQDGPRIRATMGAFFVLGGMVSLAALAVGGVLDGATMLHGLVLVPFMAVGFLASNRARALLDRGWTRPAVLAVSAVSALVLLGRALWG